MKIKLSYLIFLFHLISYSQNSNRKIIGDWVKIGLEMVDGSRYIPYYNAEKLYLEFNFTERLYSLTIYPVEVMENSIFPYTVSGNRINISHHFGYNIEKMENDTLILSEHLRDTPNEKLKKYTLIRKETAMANYKKTQTDSILIANMVYTPKFRGSIEKYLNDGLRNKHKTLELSGFLTINLIDNEVDVEFTKSSNSKSKILRIIEQRIKNSFSKWNLAGFTEYEKIRLDLIILVHKTETAYGTKVKFFTNSIDVLNADYGKSLKVMRKSSAFFNRGLDAYKKRNYKEAISQFSMSFEADHSFLDALYNRATSFYSNNQFDMACQDWKKLSDLGQINAIGLFEEHCLKN